MADRIIIAQDSQSAEDGTRNEQAQITLLPTESRSAPFKKNCGDNNCYKVSKETFLYGR